MKFVRLAPIAATLFGLTGCELPNQTVPVGGGYTPAGDSHHRAFSKTGDGLRWCLQYDDKGNLKIGADGHPVVVAGSCNPKSKPTI